VEFTIGAHYSPGGRSITCLLSTARGGTVSRIVPQLETGTVVQLPMTYIDYLVTENGVVNLEGKSRRERAEAVISVAHPDFQPDLGRAAQRLFWP
jgi:acyl-CoA hydrolase